MAQVFTPLPSVPDHPALEREVLAWWEEHGTFERLREQNRGNPPWSFIDGPITANNPMGVHHAWGRALKDVFQRYKAQQGFDLRYQNGFDCQGLWVEVEVEKSLGLNSKHEIEEYGLAEFAARCRERVAEYAGVIAEQSKRLGMWMDWDASYLTFSDTNIEYIWRFLKECQRRGWLYKGHRSTEWCPRCGTSISQHELFAGEYKELEHPSLFVRFPLKGREDEALVVWTTTPWTLPANVAAAVKPDAEYVLSDRGEWRARELAGDVEVVRSARGEELVGLEYDGPFDGLAAPGRRRPPRDPVGRGRAGRGHGDRPHRSGRGRRGLRALARARTAVLAPIDEAALLSRLRAVQGLATVEAADLIVEALREREILRRAPARSSTATRPAGAAGRRSSSASSTTGSSRCDEIREPMLEANADVAWTPRSTASGWTTGCATWATGTSRASATSACRCRSTPARAAS